MSPETQCPMPPVPVNLCLFATPLFVINDSIFISASLAFFPFEWFLLRTAQNHKTFPHSCTVIVCCRAVVWLPSELFPAYWLPLLVH